MSAPERLSVGSETPIRVFRYPDGGWRKVAADFAAGVGVAVICCLFAMGGPFLFAIPSLGFSVLFLCYASLSYRLRKHRRVRLYPDRIAWDTARGVRTIKLIELGAPQSIGWGDQGRGILFKTPYGNLILPERMDGFGDLARRIEEGKYGSSDRALPSSTAPWVAPDVFRYRGFIRFNAVFKIAMAVAALVGAAIMGEGVSTLVYFGVATLFLVLAWLDAKQYQNARIERIGNRLVEYDRWNHPVASLNLATLHHVTSHETGYCAEGRLCGDDGVIAFGSNLENALPLVKAAYAVITDRYRLEMNHPQEHRNAIHSRP
jgi:hypothetical protein